MANQDKHTIAIYGPANDIARLSKEIELVEGAIDTVTGKIVVGWDHVPSVTLGLGQYIIEKCWKSVCDVNIEFKALRYPVETCVALYHNWATAYPTLRIIWRYWLDMGCSVGYIAETGAHCWHKDADGKWVAATAD